MRTTLDIDNDVLATAKQLARRERKTAGQLVSELMREALRTRMPPGNSRTTTTRSVWIQTHSGGRRVVTNELVDGLREEMGV